LNIQYAGITLQVAVFHHCEDDADPREQTARRSYPPEQESMRQLEGAG
jgi:hypothetical protein